MIGLPPSRRSLAGGRARPGSPRIAVIGNCQAAAVTTALRLILPDAGIDYLSAYRLPRRHPTLAGLLRALRGYDHVVAGRFAAPLRDGGDVVALKAERNVVECPTVVFSAYHPDVVHVGPAERSVRGPVGGYHSAIALFGFLRGHSVEATHRLFRPETYGLLGYLGIWEEAAASLLALGREAGWDLGPDLARWARRGPFMHLVNHPRVFVTNDLARGIVGRMGLDVPEIDLDSYVEDEIVRLGAFPVYPGIAEPLGLAGSLTMLRPASGRAMPVPVRLPTFLSESFAAYGREPPARLGSPRVEQWLANDGLVADLDRMAAG